MLRKAKPGRQLELRQIVTCKESGTGVRRAKAALSSGCKPHPAKSLQPEATGADTMGVDSDPLSGRVRLQKTHSLETNHERCRPPCH